MKFKQGSIFSMFPLKKMGEILLHAIDKDPKELGRHELLKELHGRDKIDLIEFDDPDAQFLYIFLIEQIKHLFQRPTRSIKEWEDSWRKKDEGAILSINDFSNLLYEAHLYGYISESDYVLDMKEKFSVLDQKFLEDNGLSHYDMTIDVWHDSIRFYLKIIESLRLHIKNGQPPFVIAKKARMLKKKSEQEHRHHHDMEEELRRARLEGLDEFLDGTINFKGTDIPQRELNSPEGHPGRRLFFEYQPSEILRELDGFVFDTSVTDFEKTCWEYINKSKENQYAFEDQVVQKIYIHLLLLLEELFLSSCSDESLFVDWKKQFNSIEGAHIEKFCWVAKNKYSPKPSLSPSVKIEDEIKEYEIFLESLYKQASSVKDREGDMANLTEAWQNKNRLLYTAVKAIKNHLETNTSPVDVLSELDAYAKYISDEKYKEYVGVGPDSEEALQDDIRAAIEGGYSDYDIQMAIDKFNDSQEKIRKTSEKVVLPKSNSYPQNKQNAGRSYPWIYDKKIKDWTKVTISFTQLGERGHEENDHIIIYLGAGAQKKEIKKGGFENFGLSKGTRNKKANLQWLFLKTLAMASLAQKSEIETEKIAKRLSTQEGLNVDSEASIFSPKSFSIDSLLEIFKKLRSDGKSTSRNSFHQYKKTLEGDLKKIFNTEVSPFQEASNKEKIKSYYMPYFYITAETDINEGFQEDSQIKPGGGMASLEKLKNGEKTDDTFEENNDGSKSLMNEYLDTSFF